MNKVCRNAAGITLIELLISLAVLAILVVIGSVSYHRVFSEHALLQKTEQLYHFLRLANSQAVKLNKKVYVHFCQSESASRWKMALSGQSDCDCFVTSSCQLSGIETVEELADGHSVFTSEADITFTNARVSFSPMRFGINPGSVTLKSADGTRLKVIQSTMRLKICAPDNHQLGYQQC